MPDGSGYEFLVALVLMAGVVCLSSCGRRDRFKAVYILTGLVSVFIFLSMFMIAPRIEMYSQRPALEFFESVSGQDAYLVTLGYKSYAQLFYGKARNFEN